MVSTCGLVCMTRQCSALDAWKNCWHKGRHCVFVEFSLCVALRHGGLYFDKDVIKIMRSKLNQEVSKNIDLIANFVMSMT